MIQVKAQLVNFHLCTSVFKVKMHVFTKGALFVCPQKTEELRVSFLTKYVLNINVTSDKTLSFHLATSGTEHKCEQNLYM